MPRNKNTGPRRCRVTKKVALVAGKENVMVQCGAGPGMELTALKDSDVRRVRNWLNWYLDNK